MSINRYGGQSIGNNDFEQNISVTGSEETMNCRKVVRLSCLLFLAGCSLNVGNKAMPIPALAIDKNNVSRLILLRQWELENVFGGGTTFWFSSSDQFVMPASKGSVNGIQSFDVDDPTPTWFVQTNSLEATVDDNNHVITYWQGLHFFDKKGVEIQTIKTNDNCEENVASHLVAVPRTDLVVTGHQDSISDFGLNYNVDDVSSLLIWNKDTGSCSELQKGFAGRLSSLSASYDGRYLSYGFGLKDPSNGAWRATVKIYDLNLQREICSLAGLNVQFNRLNQLAVYDPEGRTISMITPMDCETKIKFKVEIVPSTFSFHPNGDLLAGAAESIVDIWDIKTSQKVHEIDLETSLANLPLIAFSPDGRFLVITKLKNSPSEMDTITLWGVPEK